VDDSARLAEAIVRRLAGMAVPGEH
jgi:hypothetical protein